MPGPKPSDDLKPQKTSQNITLQTSRIKLRRVYRIINQILMGLVSGMGILAAASILTAPNLTEAPTNYDMDSRSPASISQPDSTESSVLLVKLNCDEEMRLAQAPAQIRLKGRACTTANADIESTAIEIEKNHEVATVFHSGREFTTDVIQLAQGTTHIRLIHTLSNGNKLEQLLVVERSHRSSSVQ